jgi:hypothetical protein
MDFELNPYQMLNRELLELAAKIDVFAGIE